MVKKINKGKFLNNQKSKVAMSSRACHQLSQMIVEAK